MTKALGGALMDDSVPEKQCNTCAEIKPLSEFQRRKESLDGFDWKCKACKHEYDRLWKLRDPERARRYSREWGRRNVATLIAYTKAHPEQRSETSKRYYLSHKDKVEQNWRNRRAREKRAGGRITSEEWAKTVELYGHKCLCCGRTDVKLTLDHVIPLSKGGEHLPQNAQPLCKSCNCRKSTKTTDYRGGQNL
jgi:5-methylcytosine-specific restriction endonuclease McrA